jgi:hypothetical protein
MGEDQRKGAPFVARQHDSSFWNVLRCNFAPLDAGAQVIRTSGEFLFDPETSQNEACEAAAVRATGEALRHV